MEIDEDKMLTLSYDVRGSLTFNGGQLLALATRKLVDSQGDF